MSGGDGREGLPVFPSRPGDFNPAMTGLIPRLPRFIGPNSPRVNLNNHWDELSTWHQVLEKQRLKALAAHIRMRNMQESGNDEIFVDDDLCNRGCGVDRTFAQVLTATEVKRNIGDEESYGFPSCTGQNIPTDYSGNARERLVVTLV